MNGMPLKTTLSRIDKTWREHGEVTITPLFLRMDRTYLPIIRNEQRKERTMAKTFSILITLSVIAIALTPAAYTAIALA